MESVDERVEEKRDGDEGMEDHEERARRKGEVEWLKVRKCG